MKYVIDTHALVWFLEDNSRLGENAKNILSDTSSQLVLPAIALAEATWIVERGKTSIPSVESLLHALVRDPRLFIYPLDRATVERSVGLFQINEMHDRQIVATALVLESGGEQVAVLNLRQQYSRVRIGRNYLVDTRSKSVARESCCIAQRRCIATSLHHSVMVVLTVNSQQSTVNSEEKLTDN